MRKRVLRLIAFNFMLFVVIFLLIVFLPRNYNVPHYSIRTGTKYWFLSTGSAIAYTHIPAKGRQKPYPVIFLQGGPGGPVYNKNIALLAPLSNDGFDLYFYDQVGCGASERLENIDEYSVERHKNDLEDIVKTLGADKVILIGQSWGAMLACAFIADNPHKVEKVIFTGPGPILPVNNLLEKLNPPDSLKLRSPQYTNRQGKEKVYNIRAKFVEGMAKTFGLKLASNTEMDAFSTLLNFEMSKSTVCDSSALASQMEAGSGYYSMIKTIQSFKSVHNIREKLKNCPIPALVMRGQCDGIKWGYQNEYANLFIRHTFKIIPDAGHSISREQPAFYLDNIRGFLMSENE